MPMLVFREDKKQLKTFKLQSSSPSSSASRARNPSQTGRRRLSNRHAVYLSSLLQHVEVFVTIVYQLWIFLVPLKSEEAPPKIKHFDGIWFWDLRQTHLHIQNNGFRFARFGYMMKSSMMGRII